MAVRIGLLLGMLCSLACQDAGSTICGDFICPEGTVCTPTQDECVVAERINRCTDVAEGGDCSYADVEEGACYEKVCRPKACGNGHTEESIGENCDDGNVLPADGCSSTCLVEVCGNRLIDVKEGMYGYEAAEACDDGTPDISHDGCTVGCLCPSDCEAPISLCGDFQCDAPQEDVSTCPGDCMT